MKISDYYQVKMADYDGSQVIVYDTKSIMAVTAKEHQNKELNHDIMACYMNFLNGMIQQGYSIKDVKITSFWRNYVPVGGSKNSLHLVGKAIDFKVKNGQKFADYVLKNKEKFGYIGGLGVYDTHIHLDVGTQKPAGQGAPYFRYWDYRINKALSMQDDSDSTENMDMSTNSIGVGFFIIAILSAALYWYVKG